jgi:hypothetical protein
VRLTVKKVDGTDDVFGNVMHTDVDAESFILTVTHGREGDCRQVPWRRAAVKCRYCGWDLIRLVLSPGLRKCVICKAVVKVQP